MGVCIHCASDNEAFDCTVCIARWWADTLNYRLTGSCIGHTRTNTHANAHAFSEELEAKAKTRTVGGTTENSAMICTALVSESHCGNEPRWPWSNYI